MDRLEQDSGMRAEQPGIPRWAHSRSASRSFTLMEAAQVHLQAGGEIGKEPAAGLFLDLMLEQELVARAVLTGQGRLAARAASTLWLDAGVYAFTAVWRSDQPLQAVHQFWLERPEVGQDARDQYTLSLAGNGGSLFTRLSFGHPAQLRLLAAYEAELLGDESRMALSLHGRTLPGNSLQSLGYGERSNGPRTESIQIVKALALPAASPDNGVWQIEARTHGLDARPIQSALTIQVR